MHFSIIFAIFNIFLHLDVFFYYYKSICIAFISSCISCDLNHNPLYNLVVYVCVFFILIKILHP